MINSQSNLNLSRPTFRVTLILKENYQLNFTRSTFNELIGFDKVIIKDPVNIGQKVSNLSQDTDILNVHCHLVNTSLVDGVDSVV